MGTRYLVFAAALASVGAACDGLVGAEVECDRICITSVGPTVPGSNLPADAGLPDALATRPATMEFNVPLAQLSKSVAEADVETHLLSLRLLGQADLVFVDTVQVILRAGTTDAGVRPPDAGSADARPDSGAAATGGPTTTVGPPDGGPMPILADELPKIQASRCLAGGPGFVVANYRKPSTAGASVGKAIDLEPTTREANLYVCLRDAAAKFTVELGLVPAYLPASDTPVSLKVCIDAHAAASFP